MDSAGCGDAGRRPCRLLVRGRPYYVVLAPEAEARDVQRASDPHAQAGAEHIGQHAATHQRRSIADVAKPVIPVAKSFGLAVAG